MIIFFLLLLLAIPSWADVTHDVTSSSQIANDVSLSFNHTITNGCANNAVVVAVAIGITANTTISSVTVGGVAATHLRTSTLGTDEIKAALYGITNRTTGSALSVVVTLNQIQNRIFAGATSLCGVDQTTPFGATQVATGTISAPALSLVRPVGGMLIDAVFANATQPVPSGGSILNWDETNAYWGAGSRRTADNMSYTGTSDQWALAAVVVNAAAVVENRRVIIGYVD